MNTWFKKKWSDILLALIFIVLWAILVFSCTPTSPDGIERVTIIYVDTAKGVQATLAARKIEKGQTTWYVPRMDTVYKVDSTGKTTNEPLLINGKAQIQLFWYMLDPKYIQIVAPKPFQ